MYVDLHIHTYFSDGAQSPEEVARVAAERGISIVSVCDHNSINAYERLTAACEREKLILIQGVELDVVFEDSRMHLLAYNFDANDAAMIAMISNGRSELDKINTIAIKEMERDFENISLAEFEEYKMPLGRGGWKSINYLFDKGLSDSVVGAMKYHKKYGRGYAPKFPELKMACEIIRAAGGVPVLAHPGVPIISPGVKGEEDCEKIIRNFESMSEAGIGGVECYYPWHGEEATAMYADFCKRNNLCITCGCDGHGEFGKVVHGVTYDIGLMKIEMAKLNLKGIWNGWDGRRDKKALK